VVPLSVLGIKRTMACQWTENHRDFTPVEKSACTVFKHPIFYIPVLNMLDRRILQILQMPKQAKFGERIFGHFGGFEVYKIVIKCH